ncbi:Fe-S cluster assembly protein SufD [Sulfobacillus harzensis]|uniref:Fe-S cluster assembly protein SufD n=1 Tax=Sulfobacillus harzensis TaxID=2729629 RepID=A0A7Y0L174_9FIRM|nr:Fe-S cluster assembly protein SufD [Sulfobacillus harzensis]NMP21178.1 Fe-S cluster assembly protein SufD [Sulfobacillus harzensis]
MQDTLTTATENTFRDWIESRKALEPEWMHQRRLLAAEASFALDWPKLERTPLKKRRLDQIPLFPAATTKTAIPPEATDEAAAIVRWRGRNVVSVSVPQALADRGVVLRPLTDALDQEPVREHLGRLLDEREDKVAALNAALWTAGTYLFVPGNLPEPLSVSLEIDLGAEDTALFSRNLIVVGRNSRVLVTERITGGPESAKMLLAHNTEVVVSEGASVQYGSIQQASERVEGFIHRQADLQNDAHIEWLIGEFGSALLVGDHVSQLNQPGASTKSITVFFGSAQQHQDFTAKSFHHAPHTVSDMVARGVMKGRARSVFTGLTQIDKGARGSDGRQKEQTLMLSEEARADAIPSLLIDERDVYAAHAASAGPIDKAAVFYLTSRGLTEKEAERMIVHGFLAPVIDKIPNDPLRDQVWQAVERKIVHD